MRACPSCSVSADIVLNAWWRAGKQVEAAGVLSPAARLIQADIGRTLSLPEDQLVEMGVWAQNATQYLRAFAGSAPFRSQAAKALAQAKAGRRQPIEAVLTATLNAPPQARPDARSLGQAVNRALSRYW